MKAMAKAGRPDRSEYAEPYAAYVARVPDGPIVETLARELESQLKLLAGVDEERSLYRYAPGKWSIRELVGHLIDTERVFAARALHFARRQSDPLPGMEVEDYVAAADSNARPFADLVRELETVRHSSLTLFSGFSEEMWLRKGVASGFEFTVRAVPWIVVGHELHHREVLRERYM